MKNDLENVHTVEQIRNLNAPLTELKGIGEKSAQHFAKAGIVTISDLLTYYPRAYDTYEAPAIPSKDADGQTMAVCGFLERQLSLRRFSSMALVSGTILTQEGGRYPVTWWNQPYLPKTLKTGVRYVFRGLVKVKGQNVTLSQPQVFPPEEYEKKCASLQPVYPLVSGLTKNMLQKAVVQALALGYQEEDYLPEALRQEYSLCLRSTAIRGIHFPESAEALTSARRRLVFDEFFLFLLSIRKLRETRAQQTSRFSIRDTDVIPALLRALPYQLTGDQMAAWETIRRELKGPNVMSRLIQGDVGSGKTILAFLALIMIARSGCQGALMAPTEVLAAQHYEAFCSLMEQNGSIWGSEGAPQAVLLTGSMPQKEKREVYRRIAQGEAQVIIGTHAVFQEQVCYENLALVITDEQHRFGVRQREALGGKGKDPHVIVMSATPIPRTLAVILYGDLDVSLIREMPKNRLPIKNCVIPAGSRHTAYSFLKKQIAAGHQVYVICPMVENSESIEAENVTDYVVSLQEALGSGVCVGMLHGRMKTDEKNRIMAEFSQNKLDVLVSTTVVEVGVNVPNATVMMIEDAQRFGLAQLHQLRGRVGRGSAQSYCIMIQTDQKEETSKRLDILNHSNDGFAIAEKDLALRGPGDLFGVRQSGIPAFVLADIYADAALMQLAADAAGRILSEDSTLSRPDHRLLREKMLAYHADIPANLNI